MSLKRYAIVFVLGFWTIGSADTRTSHLYYLEKGQVVDRCQGIEGRDPAIKRLLAGHYIEGGARLVLLLRTFDQGKPFVIDDETYEKLTVELRSYEIGIPIELSSPEVKLYYSSGGAPWISRASGVFSSEASGTIIIEEKNENHLRLKLQITIPAKPAKGSTVLIQERTVEIKEGYTLQKILLEQLTPWLGMRHPSYYKEVYP
jgi:hypothetical protein